MPVGGRDVTTCGSGRCLLPALDRRSRGRCSAESVQLLQPTPPRPWQNMCPRGRLLQVGGYALNASERRARGKSRKYQSRRVNRQPPGGQGSADPVRTRGDLAQRKSGAMSWAMASRPWRGRQSAGGRHGGPRGQARRLPAEVDRLAFCGRTSTPMLQLPEPRRPRLGRRVRPPCRRVSRAEPVKPLRVFPNHV